MCSNKCHRGIATHESWKSYCWDNIWANVRNLGVLKPVLVAFNHLFPIKKCEGEFIREGAFIRINTVCCLIKIGRRQVLTQTFGENSCKFQIHVFWKGATNCESDENAVWGQSKSMNSVSGEIRVLHDFEIICSKGCAFLAPYHMTSSK